MLHKYSGRNKMLPMGVREGPEPSICQKDIGDMLGMNWTTNTRAMQKQSSADISWNLMLCSKRTRAKGAHSTTLIAKPADSTGPGVASKTTCMPLPRTTPEEKETPQE